MEGMKKLTVISYGEAQGETYRVTLQAINIAMVTSPENLVQRQGISLHKVYVRFVDEGGGAELYVNKPDLEMLEEAIGFYGIDDPSGAF